MKPTVCRVCGGRFATASLDNPNICMACATTDWLEPDPWRSEESPCENTEMDHLLKLERPTAIKCVDAEDDAITAIEEAVPVGEGCEASELHAIAK